MSTLPSAFSPAALPAPLSQPARVVDTFVAPSKTFGDIQRSAACWLPLVLVLLFTVLFAFAIDRKVGYEAVSEQQMSHNARAEEAMKSLPPDQRAARIAISAKFTRIASYGSVVFYLIFVALEALVLMASFNFGLGAATTFRQVFAVVVFSSLPRALTWLLSACLLFANVNTDSFDMQNPVGTNLGFYLTDAAKWLQTLGKFVDVLGLWSLALLVVGMAIVSRKTIAQSAAVVVGWWLLIVAIATAATAAFS